jgi:hypothetical protein
MLVTPFGDLEYGDQAGLNDWLAAHAIRHRAYRRAALSFGIESSAVQIIDGPADNDWFARHLFSHMTLARVFNAVSTTATILLDSYTWDDEAQFYMWHQANNDAHATLDQILGL